MDFRVSLTDDEFEKCKSFANGSALTQRENRSGGIKRRYISEISTDTFRGKVGEVIAKHFLEQNPLNIKDIKLDFDIYPRGKWDNQDIDLNGKKISIKSAKWFSNWLLLETKDINRGDIYDYYIFVTVSKDFKSGTLKGFATKDEVLIGNKTLKLNKGEFIPRTNTVLDADNHAIHSIDLHNSEKEWIKLFKEQINS